MYRNKTRKLKKGYVLVYTLLIALFIITLLIFSFTLELKKTKNIENYKKDVSSIKKYEQYREYLLTELNRIINTNISVVSKDNIKAYFTVNSVIVRVDENKGSARYNRDEDCFYVESYEDNYTYRREIFDYDVISSTLKFTFRKEEYVKGVIL